MQEAGVTWVRTDHDKQKWCDMMEMPMSRNGVSQYIKVIVHKNKLYLLFGLNTCRIL